MFNITDWKQDAALIPFRRVVAAAVVLLVTLSGQAETILLECEQFKDLGGWKVDSQFIDEMGSSYLLAHGLGKPVDDATTTFEVKKPGKYNVFVRTKNWTAKWMEKVERIGGGGARASAGRFNLIVNGEKLPNLLGVQGKGEWLWVKAGDVELKAGTNTLALHDVSGFDGRCDAVCFTTRTDEESFRCSPSPSTFTSTKKSDLVVVGGGIAGICTAISAARLGLKVALVQDRPVLGGANSSEVRVHLGGYQNLGPYPRLGDVVSEIGPAKGGNARPAAQYEDDRKLAAVKAEKNIELFLNTRVVGVEPCRSGEMEKKAKSKGEVGGRRIDSVVGRDVVSGRLTKFVAPLFVDCTGDGCVGYLAGADWRLGRESKAETGEDMAPEKGDKMTMGASCQWYAEKKVEVGGRGRDGEKVEVGGRGRDGEKVEVGGRGRDGEKAKAKGQGQERKITTTVDLDLNSRPSFPSELWMIKLNEEAVDYALRGDWNWETGMNRDQLKDFETVRDYGMLVAYSNWNHVKNVGKRKAEFTDAELAWVAYVAGKRETRRLLGDHILCQQDVFEERPYPDGTCCTTWAIDLHYPMPANQRNYDGEPFRSICTHNIHYAYPIPYRCFYSRNVPNLFMAGRDISVTHVALGTTRVMRTHGMMGEVVGMAASICKKHGCDPRGVYTDHLDELKALMTKGVGLGKPQPPQNYNEGCMATLTVDGKLPAGNVVVEKIDGDRVQLSRELRDTTTDWFYWAFRVKGAKGRTLNFVFDSKISGGGPVGVRGPAVTKDGGKTWSYPCDGKSTRNTFTYTFDSDDEVRFYETWQYLPNDWESFLAAHAADRGKKFATGELCKSRKGRSVPNARFGCINAKPKYRFFFSSRHHCSEATATPVLEGVAAAFLADDELGQWLCANVELMVVPFTDYDGVVDGDQGKNRAPHDHNRDYTEFLYPETRGIRDWIAAHTGGRLDVFLDVHCPWIRDYSPKDTNEFLYTPWKDPAILPDPAAETCFSELLEQLQCGSMRYRAKDDVQFGTAWNTAKNYHQGLSAVMWACKAVKGLTIARTYEVPFANARGAVVTPQTCRELGRDTAKVLRTLFIDREAVKLENAKGRATVSLLGANVISYVPAGKGEVLFRPSGKIAYRPGEWRNEGIPISFPWFDTCCEKGLPMHGFARNRRWKVVSCENGQDRSRLVLSLASDAETRKLWPHDFALEYVIELADTLSARLVIKNPAKEPVKLMAGLHPYYAISDVEAVNIDGFGPTNAPVRQGVHRFIPAAGFSATVDDVGFGRKLHLEAKGTRDAVIWNVGSKWKNFRDFRENDPDTYVCVEPTMSSPSSAVEIPAGGEYAISLKIAVKGGRVEADDPVADPYADPDGDGLINLHEYWTGCDPKVPDGSNTVLSVLARSVDSRLGGDPKERILKFAKGHYPDVLNTNCWAYGIDTSSASPFNNCRGSFMAGTALTPRHIVMAAHYGFSKGHKVRFFGTDGKSHERSVVATRRIGRTDVLLCLLDADLPAAVRPAKLLPKDYRRYIRSGKGLPALMFDFDEKAGVTEIDSLPIDGGLADGRVPTAPRRRAFFEAVEMGDSGDPKFLVLGDEAILVCHIFTWGRGKSGAGPFLTPMADELQTAMDKLSDDNGTPRHRLQFADLSAYPLLPR